VANHQKDAGNMERTVKNMDYMIKGVVVEIKSGGSTQKSMNEYAGRFFGRNKDNRKNRASVKERLTSCKSK
jgi:hypothetical protein